MSHAAGSIIVDRPVELVFNFILDGENNPLWRPSVIEVRRTTQETGVGATYRQVIKGPGGNRIDGDYRIIECKPGQRIRFEVTGGPVRPVGKYLFEDLGDSTQVQLILDFQPHGLARLMDGMVEKAMREEVAVLENLKKVLESG